MKRFFLVGFLVFALIVASQGISPYIQIAELRSEVTEAKEKIVSVLEQHGYNIIGDYRPGNNSDLHVVAFTNSSLQDLCGSAGSRGMLAAAVKVGIERKDGITRISVINPEYLFYAYFRGKMEETSFKTRALSVSSKIKQDLKGIGNMQKSFGGNLDAKELMKYRYMMGMPDFGDPVDLKEFDTFNNGIATIRKNLSAGKAGTVQVYEILDESRKIAVFGVGLLDPDEGESHFLPIIGEGHVAAMPYDIILVNKRATMLHGRYRFALHWPDLTMKTFTKIMSSPGDVEDAMKQIVQ